MSDWKRPRDGPAEAAIDVFADKYGAKYDKAVACLTKDRDVLLAFFDFPAEHWDHLRTSNPIESVFATVRHRTVRTKESLGSPPRRPVSASTYRRRPRRARYAGQRWHVARSVAHGASIR